MLKMPSHCSFKLDLHELWLKEGVGIKLVIWFPIIDPLKARSKCGSIWACYTLLELFLKDIKYGPCILKTYLIWERYECQKFWDDKSLDFGTPTWKSQGKMTFGCSPYEEA
jgi:hypothetical protein